jgi:hypothetical protein
VPTLEDLKQLLRLTRLKPGPVVTHEVNRSTSCAERKLGNFTLR